MSNINIYLSVMYAFTTAIEQRSINTFKNVHVHKRRKN